MVGWFSVPRYSVYLYVLAWRVVHDTFEPKAFVVESLASCASHPHLLPAQGQ